MTTVPASTTERLLAASPHSLKGLRAADRLWQRYRQGPEAPRQVVYTTDSPLGQPDWDVIISGGTLGILLATALVQRGWRVALLEKGALRGRQQEWNISRRELETLVTLGLLRAEELEATIATTYNPARVQFGAGDPLWVRDVLNIGVDPVTLLETLKQRFLTLGGQLFEHTAFDQATVHPDGVQVEAGDRPFTTRLLIDAMGHFSPMVQQARWGQRPEGVCLVVGTCAQGFPKNDTGDLIVSFTPIRNQCQYFWEAFPARDGRTTYLFTYVDAHPDRPSLETLFDDYWALLPQYQGVQPEQLDIQRALFGFFPCYPNSPLHYPWGRVLPVGDSSGSQSPLSFGGFGAMIRHLPRLVNGLDEALSQDCLSASALAWLQPYQPNLSVTWLFQRAMRVGREQSLDPEQINRVLATIFADMAALGEDTLKPFLQDVVQFPALARTLACTSRRHPTLVAQILPQVGLPAVMNWVPHYLALAGYQAAYPLARWVSPWAERLPAPARYTYHRWLDALRYGTGSDYDDGGSQA